MKTLLDEADPSVGAEAEKLIQDAMRAINAVSEWADRQERFSSKGTTNKKLAETIAEHVADAAVAMTKARQKLHILLTDPKDRPTPWN
jgi:hypothetical protein